MAINPYNKSTWANNTTPDINAANLNKMEQGIYDNSVNIIGVNNDVNQVSEYTKNLANFYDVAETTVNGITYSCKNNNIKISGQPLASGNTDIRFYLKDGFSGGNFTLSFKDAVTTSGCVCYMHRASGYGTNKGLPASEHPTATFAVEVADDVDYIMIRFGSTSARLVCNTYMQIEKADSATAYTPTKSAVDIIARDDIDVLNDTVYDIPFQVVKPSFVLENGATFSSGSAYYVHIGYNSEAGRAKAISVEEGDYVQIVLRNTIASGNYMRYGICTIDANGNYVRNLSNATTNPDEIIKIQSGEKYLCLNFAEYDSSGTILGLRVTDFNDGDVEISVFKKYSVLSLMQKKEDKINGMGYNNPIIANGTLNNVANAYMIRSQYTIPTFGAKSITVKFNINFQYLMYVLFRKFSVYTEGQASSSSTNQIANYSPINNQTEIFEKRGTNICIIDVSDCEAFSIAVGDNDSLSGGSNQHTLRLNEYQNCIDIFYNFNMDYAKDAGSGENVVGRIKNARHIPGSGTTKPLTILHFSDLHGDSAALNRINEFYEENENLIDDVICTGDIVPNTAAQISSWWKPKFLTCIGNHDTASYNSSTGYDWTALSMADRISYYISPFESNWGDITRPSGKSYYFKDYDDAKVRMVVMDGMLYTNAGTDATNQTTWLGNVLDEAKSIGYHVLIAIHAPHPGSVPRDCSFGKRNQTVMPVHSSCTTPQEVVDVVASKISAGLKFIGYIVGHTHQDDMWDAEDNGKQLMYCVTCAAVDQVAQWQNSDQFRDRTLDAFNLVTIDTANNFVKIVRGGGANIDNVMRNRKQICFYYADGTIIAEDE